MLAKLAEIGRVLCLPTISPTKLHPMKTIRKRSCFDSLLEYNLIPQLPPFPVPFPVSPSQHQYQRHMHNPTTPDLPHTAIGTNRTPLRNLIPQQPRMRNLRPDTTRHHKLPILIHLQIWRRWRSRRMQVCEKMTQMKDMSTRKPNQSLRFVFREWFLAPDTMA
jgi:hypothetical protein